jgi:tetratricopeptide (TPR) repeat protein
MLRFLLPLVLAASACAGDAPLFELAGTVKTETRAAVSLFGDSSPFSAYTTSDESGRFTFKKLLPGTYTLAVFVPARGEARRTVEVGPGTADAHGRVALSLEFKDSDFVFADAMRRRNSVSASQLAIPEKAEREYEEAERELGRHNVEAATSHLEEAVRLAPQFSAAWNNLGTIAYQTQQFDRAETCFREALKQDPQSFEPLVNLGGVLVTVHKLDEAWEYNAYAVMARPNDALANAQMGQTYFLANNYELALKYLERARQIDPAHFSRPQLFMAEIHLRQGDPHAAAGDLEDFLKHHPDWPQAEKMRAQIAAWRKQ